MSDFLPGSDLLYSTWCGFVPLLSKIHLLWILLDAEQRATSGMLLKQAVGCLVEQQASLDGQDQLWWPWCCQSTTQTCLVASGAKEREVASLAWASKPVQNAKHLRNIAIHVVVLSIGVSITMLMLQYRRSCIVLLIDLFLGWKLDVAGP